MSLHIRTLLTGLFALIAAFLLALAPAGAKPASGGYQLFEPVALEHQAVISLAALENFDYFAKIAPECCDADYNPALGAYDYRIATEYLDVANQYGFASSEAMSEAARAALAEIPIDTATGLLNLVGVSKDALAGDPEARAQLWAAAAAAKSLVEHPIDTIEAGIKRDLDRADQLEAEGKFFEADKLRSKTILNLQLSVTGAGAAVTGLTKGGVKLVGKGETAVEATKGGENPYEGPVQIGQTTTYGDSVNRSIVGDGLTGDHMPSRAAIQTRVETEIGRPLTQAESAQLKNSTGCVIVTGAGHCALSNTFGGRNSPDRILNDSGDLRNTADANFTAMIPDLRANGMTSEQIDAARTRLHHLNGSIINDLNTQYGTQIPY